MSRYKTVTHILFLQFKHSRYESEDEPVYKNDNTYSPRNPASQLTYLSDG